MARSAVICALARYFQCGKNKEDEIDGTYNRHGRKGNAYKSRRRELYENLKEIHH
jgi:hypothetical protein